MIAANTLGVVDYNANKDETAVGNKSDVRDASEDISSIGSNDGDERSESAHSDTPMSGGKENLNADAGSDEEETWPQLMILGCGRLMAFET